MGAIVLAGTMAALGQSRATIESAIVSEAARQSLDPQLALAVAEAESGLNQSQVSSAGAIGIFQLMPATAAWLGVNAYDWADNIRGGVKYLKWLQGRYNGNLTLMLAGYNWGPGNLEAAQAAYGSQWFSAAPLETQRYIATISADLGPSPVLTAGFGGSGDVLSYLLLGIAAVLALS